MRPLLALVALLGVTDSSQQRALRQDARDRRLSRIIQAPGGGDPAYVPLFALASASGVGMGTACAGTTPTGTKGEVVTFTRASDAYCTKGNETTGIVSGDLVLLTTDQPRVMPGGSGTGPLGIGRHVVNVNDLLRSQELDNAAWFSDAFGGVANPTITADAAVAPDGTTTADRFQFPAVTAVQSSLRGQSIDASARSCGIYVRGHGGTSGTIYLENGVTCAPCAYVGASYTRCTQEGSANQSVFYFGNDGFDCGGITNSALDVDVWQGDCNERSRLGPPIKTAGTAATMAAESITIDTPTGISATGCMGVTVVNANGTSPVQYVPVNVTGVAYGIYSDTPNPGNLYMFDSVNGAGPQAYTVTSPLRLIGYWGSSVMGGSTSNGAVLAPSVFDGSMFANGTTLNLGGFADGTYQANGVIKLLALDNTIGGCQ